MDTVSVERETVAEVDGFREHVTVNIIAKKIRSPHWIIDHRHLLHRRRNTAKNRFLKR